ncbi:MAG: transcription antitermination factor NusB [Oscillospiraceae bacterium]|jgi:N utilization substance protein B
MSRRKARESAFKIVFSHELNGDSSPEEVYELEDEGDLEHSEFCTSLVEKTLGNLDEIDALIVPNLKNWKLERLPKTTLAILRISTAQLLYFDDIPKGVVINEAVELAKKYGGEGDYSFVNGMLRNISGSIGEKAPVESEGKE